MYSDMSRRNHRGLVVEQILGKRLGQLRSCRRRSAPQEHERAGRAGSGPAGPPRERRTAVANRMHRLGLAHPRAWLSCSSILRSLSFSPLEHLVDGPRRVQRDTTCAMWLAVTASSTVAPAFLNWPRSRPVASPAPESCHRQAHRPSGIRPRRCAIGKLDPKRIEFALQLLGVPRACSSPPLPARGSAPQIFSSRSASLLLQRLEAASWSQDRSPSSALSCSILSRMISRSSVSSLFRLGIDLHLSAAQPPRP